MNSPGGSPVCTRPLTAESCLGSDERVCAGKEGSISWVSSQAATDVDNRELSSRAQWDGDNGSPNTAASFSIGPNFAR